MYGVVKLCNAVKDCLGLDTISAYARLIYISITSCKFSKYMQYSCVLRFCSDSLRQECQTNFVEIKLASLEYDVMKRFITLSIK